MAAIRKFRAIVQSTEEPKDHQVLWMTNNQFYYWSKGCWQPVYDNSAKTATDITYTTSEDEKVQTVQDALDDAIYKELQATFTLAQSGEYERGTVIDAQDFQWTYNKDTKSIVSQSINGVSLDTTLTAVSTTQEITEDTKWVFMATDGKTTVEESATIKFKDYVYCGVGESLGTLSRLDGDSITLTANEGEYLYVFIPSSLGYGKIYFGSIDSTVDFTSQEYTNTNSTGLAVEGTLYQSIHKGLGTVTLKIE